MSDLADYEPTKDSPKVDQHNADGSTGIQGSGQHICVCSGISVCNLRMQESASVQLYLAQKVKRRRLIKYWKTNPTAVHGI